MAVSFLFGNPVKVNFNNKKKDVLKDAYDELIDVLEDNKIKYFD